LGSDNYDSLEAIEEIDRMQVSKNNQILDDIVSVIISRFNRELNHVSAMKDESEAESLALKNIKCGLAIYILAVCLRDADENELSSFKSILEENKINKERLSNIAFLVAKKRDTEANGLQH